MQDPIADMLTIIRNGQRAKYQFVTFSASKLKEEIVKVLLDEGYIEDFQIEQLPNTFKKLTVTLKYYHGKPVIERIKRISRPGLRVYKTCNELTPVPGFGVRIISTSKGIMTQQVAKSKGIGGEVICEVA